MCVGGTGTDGRATRTRADPDGEYLDIDDVRMTWEEFVDALRDATGASQEAASALHDAKSYDALERPVMRRNESFNKLAVDLEALVLSQTSPKASAENTPEGSTRGVQRISSSGMILGIGCSSREPSVRGGGAFFSEKSKLNPSELQEKLQNAS